MEEKENWVWSTKIWALKGESEREQLFFEDFGEQ